MGALTDTSKLPVFQTALQIRGTVGGTVAIPTGGAPANWSLTPNAIYYGFASILKAITVALDTASGGTFSSVITTFGQGGCVIARGPEPSTSRSRRSSRTSSSGTPATRTSA